ncbi:hypothetical protein HDU67_009533 [Dinochytrium kinnereticum]|nr:hypothetical protein HDU67_009533 [Dinochytrium kinnereticum]
MCYVRSAPTAALQVAASAPAAAADIEAKLALLNAPAPISSFTFPDLASLDSLNDNQWFNLDCDAPLPSTAPVSSDFSMDFTPWLDSISMDLPFPMTNDPLFDAGLPTNTPTSAASLSVFPQDDLDSPFLGVIPSLKTELAREPVCLPSPPNSDNGAENSAFPSLCSPLPAATSPDMFITTANNQSGAPASPPPSGGSSSDESSSAPTSRKNPRKRAAPTSRKASSASSNSSSSGNGRKRLASDDGDDEDPEGGDDGDESALKRAKNTEAARRSRARKLAKLESLQTDVDGLERDKSALLVRLAVLENEQVSFSQREADLNARIQQLEGQLAESHRAMILSMHR